MSKRSYLYRHLLIIRRLQKCKATFEEIKDYLQCGFEVQGENSTPFSIRTFQRDRQEILSLYSIDIEYDFRRRLYYISDNDNSNLNLRILDNFEIFNALQMTEDIAHFIHLEKRKPIGTEYMYDILQAIKERNIALVNYQRFNEDKPSRHLIQPYALKEFKGRWYLIGLSLSDDYIRVFALDRVLDFSIKSEKYQKTDPAWNVHEYFKDCYGVIKPKGDTPQKVVLSFTPEQGRYIKTLPLHEPQKILIDNNQELRIELFLFLTYDLIMELMSYGDDVKVISPERLKKDLCKRCSETLKQYTVSKAPSK
jgi:predicted DNA-binding transcriptional regulator YafY